MCSTVKKYRTYRNEEDSEDSSVLPGRNRGWSTFPGSAGRRSSRYEHTGYVLPPSKLREDDGNMAMRDVHEGPQVRYTAYAVRRDQNRMWRDTKPQETEIWQDTQGGTTKNWFKVTIPYGRKYDKTWLMNSIRSHCRVPFTPVDFHYDKNWARFFVQGARAASALNNVSQQIRDEESRKIVIVANPSSVPYSVRNKFTPEQMEQIKLTMQKRYNASKQALDLQKLRFDPDLVGHDIDMILNRRHCMAATLQLIQRNCPELLSLNLCNNKLYRLDGLSDVVEKAPHVKILNLSRNELKSMWELYKVKGLKLEELWLQGNPLCHTFPDRSAYVSAIREYFPNLLRLDGQELSPPTVIDIDVPESIKPCEESSKVSENTKNLVLQFLQEYYLAYDYGDRQSLLGAYHDEACFSLVIAINPRDPDPSHLSEYFRYSRNVKKLKDSHVRRQLLKHPKHDIVDTLRVLPQTQHDLSSCVVDMWLLTEKVLCFSISGLFKEVEGKSQGCVRAFTQTFVATPGRSSSLCIVNDQLFVRDISHDELQSALSTPLPTSCSSSKPTLSLEQQQMVQAFSTQSGMNLEWSQKCLEDNEWNYTRASQIFTVLRTEGKIPEEAFKQMP